MDSPPQLRPGNRNAFVQTPLPKPVVSIRLLSRFQRADSGAEERRDCLDVLYGLVFPPILIAGIAVMLSIISLYADLDTTSPIQPDRNVLFVTTIFQILGTLIFVYPKWLQTGRPFSEE
ncbi:hypothetical protein L207DRAFT_581611 [Hyaloscypha variabilis F]|uniref:Uncharacterized protein n=1 Tax=Hyaloscypha variabilis (strain UAMH 11265 / GT02V1 / F) TaxID=1149755 RepID=A0A2J6RRS9_HYAVF|nr:hypothetical protein L207DRAFT_581611 [Hyaloscypha variabilis F]